MEYLAPYLFFYLGCIFASFTPIVAEIEGEYLNCEALCCDKCRKTFKIKHFIPLMLIFSRKCTYCGYSISIQYPISQIINGLAFFVIYEVCGANISSFLLMLLFSCLVIMSVIDIKCRAVPDLLQYVIAAIGMLYAFSCDAMWRFANVFFVFLTFFIIHYLLKKIYRKEVFGMGDVMIFGASNFFFDLVYLPLFLILAGLFGLIIGVLWRFLYKERFFPFFPAISSAIFLICIYQPVLRSDVWIF